MMTCYFSSEGKYFYHHKSILWSIARCCHLEFLLFGASWRCTRKSSRWKNNLTFSNIIWKLTHASDSTQTRINTICSQRDAGFTQEELLPECPMNNLYKNHLSIALPKALSHMPWSKYKLHQVVQVLLH